ncbi:MAG: ERF family protein [Caldilineaceae bacterium]
MNSPNTLPTQRDRTAVSSASSTTPSDLIRYAMESNADLEKLEKLFELQTRWEEREAKKAFVADMAEFKRLPLAINKDNHVEFRTDKGITAYDHATIGNVVGVIVPALAEFGFSHRWIIERGEGGLIRVRCVITHRLGHSEETVLEAGLDQTGGKNNIQAMISTKTYLERHSLLAATGLATMDTPDGYDEEAEKAKEAAALAAKEAKNKDGKPKYPEPWRADKFKAIIEGKQGKLVSAGTHTADALIVWMVAKAPLTAAQEAEIRALAPAQSGDVMASEDELSRLRLTAEDLGITEAEICKKFALASLNALPANMVLAVAKFISDPIGM